MAIKRGHERIELTLKIEDKKCLKDLAEFNDMNISEFVRSIVLEKLQDEGYIEG